MADVTCVGIMTIATESASEREIENVSQAEDQPSGNGNRNGNVNENESGIVGTNGQTRRIVQDTKRNGKRGKNISVEEMS